MQHPKYLVLFDIDGTLLKAWGCGLQALKLAMLEVFGTYGSMDSVHFPGKTDWGILIEALAETGITPADIEPQVSTYNAALLRHLTAIIPDYTVEACPGAPEVVAALHANPAVMLGLVTGNMSKIVALKLTTAGFDPAHFPVGAFGSEGWERAMLPPIALQRAEAASGVCFEPENVVIIGDTPGDISCAQSIGARTIAVATGPFTSAELRAHSPTHTFESMADPDAILAAILRNGHRGA